MFIEIDAKDLVIGTKYVITVYSDKYYTARFKYHTSGPGQHFYNAKKHSRIENIYMHTILLNMYNKNRASNFAFVQQKEKIQQDMEQRALNKILKRLVNEHFEW